MVLDPEASKDVMIKYFNNFQDNEFTNATDIDLDPILGRNPFFLSGENDEWKKKRNEISPAFSQLRV